MGVLTAGIKGKSDMTGTQPTMNNLWKRKKADEKGK